METSPVIIHSKCVATTFLPNFSGFTVNANLLVFPGASPSLAPQAPHVTFLRHLFSCLTVTIGPCHPHIRGLSRPCCVWAVAPVKVLPLVFRVPPSSCALPSWEGLTGVPRHHVAGTTCQFTLGFPAPLFLLPSAALLRLLRGPRSIFDDIFLSLIPGYRLLPFASNSLK